MNIDVEKKRGFFGWIGLAIFTAVVVSITIAILAFALIGVAAVRCKDIFIDRQARREFESIQSERPFEAERERWNNATQAFEETP